MVACHLTANGIPGKNSQQTGKKSQQTGKNSQQSGKNSQQTGKKLTAIWKKLTARICSEMTEDPIGFQGFQLGDSMSGSQYFFAKDLVKSNIMDF